MEDQRLREIVWEHSIEIDYQIFKFAVWPSLNKLINALLADLDRFGEDEGSEIKIEAIEYVTGLNWEEAIEYYRDWDKEDG